MTDILIAGLTPATPNDLLWTGFCLLATYFLWSIKTELSRINNRLEKNSTEVEDLKIALATQKAFCKERNKYHDRN